MTQETNELRPPEPTPAPATPPAAGDRTFTQAELDGIIRERLDRQQRAIDAKATKDREAIEADQAAKQGEFQKLAEAKAARVAELEAEIATRDHDALRRRVADKHGLPAALAVRLMGDTEDELTADAKELAKLVTATPAAPTRVPGAAAGPKPSGSTGSGPEAARDEMLKTGRYSRI